LDIFAFQDTITESVVGLVEPTIRKAEIERSRRKRPENLDAYELFLQAIPAIYGMGREDYTAAIALLERAIDIEPTFALALAFTAWAYEKRLSLASHPALQTTDAARCLDLAARALAAGADDPMVLGICGWLVCHVGRENAKGLAALRRSLAANPNSLVVLNLAGTANAQIGDLREARSYFARALKISPGAPDAFQSLTTLAMVEVVDDNAEAAVALCQRALSTFNEWPFTYIALAAAYAYLGRAEEARSTVDRILQLVPGLTVSALLDGPTNRATGRWPKIVEGLKLAGLPTG
jgi:tetratricopeptide (TPR) repeat protein